MSNGKGLIWSEPKEEVKDDLAVALIEKNHVDDALGAWPNSLCRP